MSKRNQLAGALCALDGGHARYTEHIALFRLARDDQAQRRRMHADLSDRDSDAMRFIFRCYVDHVRGTARIEVG